MAEKDEEGPSRLRIEGWKTGVRRCHNSSLRARSWTALFYFSCVLLIALFGVVLS